MKPIPFDYFAPTSVDEALTHLNELGYAGKVLAGGQSLIPAMNFRMARPGALVDLNNIPDLAYIRPNADGSVAVGTMTRDSAVEKHAVIAERFPLIAEVMTYIAHPQIRNRGTFGGAIAHADPAAQLPALSLLMNADLKIQKQGGQRVVAAEEFFFGPFMTVIEPEELLTEVLLRPLPAHTGSSYKQVSRQRGGYAQVAVAAAATLNADGSCKQIRLVLISVGDTPILSKEASRILVGQKPSQEAFQEVAEAVVNAEIDPGSDVHATADYRRHLTRVLTVRGLSEAFERAAVEGV